MPSALPSPLHPVLPPDRPLRVVALGDSNAEGLWDPAGPDTFRGWTDRLAQHLDQHLDGGVHYANLAIRGRRSGQIRAEQLPAALAMRPHLALVVAGLNDIIRPRLDPHDLEVNLQALHGRLADAGARVVAFTMPDMRRVMPLSRLFTDRLHLLNEVVRGCGQRFGSIVLDLATEPVGADPALWHDDRLHANAEGHRRIAAAAAEALDLPMSPPMGEWRTPPRPAQPPSGWQRVVGETVWTASHLLPWIGRRALGRSSGDGITPKRPELAPL